MPNIRLGAHARLALLVVATVTLPLGRVAAQSAPDTSRAVSAPPNLSGAFGLGIAALPRYVGSDEYRTILLPVLQLEFKGRFFVGGATNAVGGGLGAHLVRTASFTWDVGLSGSERRLERRGHALAGMGDRAAASFVTSAVAYRIGGTSVSVGGALGLGEGQGNYGSVALSNERQLGSRWFGSVTGSAVVADADNMAFEFGVTPLQAATRKALRDAGDPRLLDVDVRAFAPGGGLRDTRGSAMLGYLASTRSRVLLFAHGSRLSGAAARSPLVRTSNAMVAGVAYVRSF